MRNKILQISSFLLGLYGFQAVAADYKAAVVVPFDNPRQADEIASGLKKAFSDGRFELIIQNYTETCEPDKDRRLIAKIIRDEPDFIIGYSCKDAVEIAEEKLQPVNIPLFLIGGNVPTKHNYPQMFNMVPDPKVLYKDFVDQLAEEKNAKYLMLDDTTGQGIKLIEMIKEKVEADRLIIVKMPPKKLEQNIKKLSQISVSKYNYIVVTSEDPLSAVRMVSRVREAGIKVPILGVGALGSPEFSKMIGDMKHGIYFYAAQGGRFSLDAASVVADMRFDDKIVGDASVMAYAVGQVFLKSYDITENKYKFYNRKIRTVLGHIEFNREGELKGAVEGHFYKWNENVKEPYFQVFDK